MAVGPAGVHSDSELTFQLLAEVAARHGLRRRTQANEQVDVVIALERYGRRTLDLLEDWGWLAPDVTLAHLCAVTPDEIARLARAGVSATHAPGCDLPMGWGIAPVAELLAAGIPVGLGTSGGGSNDVGHLLADARLAMQVAPLVGRPLAAREVLGMASEGSAQGLGRAELGHLRPRVAADLCVWDVSGWPTRESPIRSQVSSGRIRADAPNTSSWPDASSSGTTASSMPTNGILRRNSTDSSRPGTADSGGLTGAAGNVR